MSRKISFALIVLGSLTLFSSCEEDEPISEIRRNQNVNDWILENMEMWYLWNDKLPGKTNKDLYPEQYFESLLYRESDRFSWIQENYIELLELLSGVQLEAGYDFSLGEVEDNSLAGLINYVKPNSPAAQAGLKRGDFFLTINGAQLPKNNDETLQNLLNALSANHTLGISEQNAIREVSLSVVKYEENPILLDTVYDISNKKIGYLIYNFFAQDNGNNSLAYVKELNQVFGKFQEQGINELILDLRYNSGGAMSTSVALSSMIANRPSSDLFGNQEVNSLLDSYLRETEGADYNKIFFQDRIEKYDTDGRTVLERVPINKLTGLNRIYVLTSDRTASASELVINGLQPYMNVVLIGTTTVGKNVGSVALYENDPQKRKNNTWGMLPIVVKFTNAVNSSDYGNGFVPDVKVGEYQELPIFPLGDTEEVVLRTALIHIGVRAERSQENDNLRADKIATFSFRPVISSIDLTPARRNVFLD